MAFNCISRRFITFYTKYGRNDSCPPREFARIKIHVLNRVPKSIIHTNKNPVYLHDIDFSYGTCKINDHAGNKPVMFRIVTSDVFWLAHNIGLYSYPEFKITGRQNKYFIHFALDEI